MVRINRLSFGCKMDVSHGWRAVELVFCVFALWENLTWEATGNESNLGSHRGMKGGS